jgi:MFS family permease
LVDKPAEAGWLTECEKRLVLADLEADHYAAGPREHGFGQAVNLGKVWLLTAIRFCGTSSNITIGFWVPAIIAGFGVSNAFTIGMLSTVPSIASLIGVVLVGRHSDRTLERRYHSALPYLASGLGLIGIGVFAGPPVLAFACLIMAVAGPIVANGPFWQIPSILLAGSAAAGGIALINSIGALSGWVGPSVVGWLEGVTGKTTTGLYIVAGLEILGSALILLFIPRRPLAAEPPRSRPK